MTPTSQSVLKLPGKFNPGRNRDIILDNYIDYLTKLPLNTDQDHRNNSNMSKDEWQALKELTNDTSIVIKEADKGGAFVVMDSTFYKTKITDMLNDKNTYQGIPIDREMDAKKKLEKFVKKYSKILTKDEQKYICDFDMKTSNIYGLPKIHKCKQIIDAINSQKTAYIQTKESSNLKFRPIIAGPICPTSHLSAFLDEIFKPFLPHVKSYIRDDQDFMQKLDRDMEDTKIFATFDVESLYTNIEHQLGKTAITYWMDQVPQKIAERFTKNMILEAMDVVLKNNIFLFDDSLYIQLTGTAMGTKMAPTYANLVLGYLETSLYESLEAPNSEFRTFVETGWKRYLDDAYITWDNTHGDINAFASKLNDLHPKINFTIDTSSEEIPFLDIKLIRSGNKIITDIFHKGTDTFNYLPFKSCHPRHIKRNIPFTLARRIRMLCEQKDTRTTRYEELKQRLTIKGFPSFIIEAGIKKAEDMTDEELNSSKDSDDDRIVAISTHNPNNPNMESLVQKSLNILQSSPKMETTLKKKRVVFAKRQPPNLKGLLCRAAFSSNQASHSVSKCGKNCETCKNIKEDSSMLITATKKIFHVKYNMNCNTRNVLYILTCEGCNKQYVGETGNELKTRMTVHRQQIRDSSTRKLAVSGHISSCGKGKFSVFPFYKMHSENTTERRIKENHFISTFKPELNAIDISN